MFAFEQNKRGNVVVITLFGRLDAITSSKMKPVLDGMFERNEVQVVYDLKCLELIDSSGVGVIVSTFKRSRVAGGDTKLAHLTGQPLEIFRVLSLNKAISVYPSVADAVNSFRSGKPHKYFKLK